MKFSEYLIEQFELDEQRNLNSKIWDGEEMREDVKEALKAIADSFIKYVNTSDLVVKDITMTGSLANYTWHDKSDIDLHIIAEMKKIQDVDTIIELFSAKKGLWNNEHDVEIKGFPVELYVQPSSEAHASSGVYSIQNSKWIVRPKKTNPEIDDSYVINKARKWKKKIDDVIKHKADSLHNLDRLKKRLRDMRKMGLDRDGEFSAENLAYKILRRDGYIKKLYDYARDLQDKQMSLE